MGEEDLFAPVDFKIFGNGPGNYEETDAKLTEKGYSLENIDFSDENFESSSAILSQVKLF